MPQNPELTRRLQAALGPNFNYGSVASILQSPVASQLPTDMRESLQTLVEQQALMRTASAPFPSDNPPTGVPLSQQPPQAPSETLGYVKDYAMTLTRIMNPILGAQENVGRITQLVGAGVPLHKAVQTTTEDQNQVLQQFGHDLSVGLIPAPVAANPKAQAAFDMIVKPVTAIGAMALQGWGLGRMLGMVSKLPAINASLEQLPLRLKEVGVGVIVAGGIDAARADGVPKDPSWLDPSGKIASELVKVGVPERLALFAGGATLGASVSSIFAGVRRGLNAATTYDIARSVGPEGIDAIRSHLRQAGVVVDDQASAYNVTKQFLANIRRTDLGEQMAGPVADRLAKETYIVNDMLGSANIAPASEDARLLTGIFRNNPGGVSVAQGLTDHEAVNQMQQRLGINVMFRKVLRGSQKATVDIPEVRNPDGSIVSPAKTVSKNVPVYDILISRPNYAYDDFSLAAKDTKRLTGTLKGMASEAAKDPRAPKTPALWILADGDAIRGNLDPADISKKFRLQAPVISGAPDLNVGLRKTANLVEMEIGNDNSVTVRLPGQLTKQQFNALGRSIDTMKFDKVTLLAADGQKVDLSSPLGQVVQDHVAGFVKPRSVDNPLTSELVKQFQKQGVFEGQAAVLADGTPGRIVRKAGLFYDVRDPLTGDIKRVHPSKLTVLPTTLDNEMQPSNLFLRYLAPEEQKSFAELRRGINSDLANPIKTSKQLESFANARGYFTRALKAGRIEVSSALDGEALTFDNVKSATEFVRRSAQPMPELTPPDITKYLGLDANFGGIGGGSGPPQFGELIPVPFDKVLATMEGIASGRGAGAFELAFKPSLRLMGDLDKRYGTPYLKVFMNLQSQYTGKQNFETAWYTGQAPGMPEGVMPLRKILNIAGKEANGELLTDWLESVKGGEQEKVILAQMSPEERKAAPELRKWYNALFESFGVEADYVENYAPRWREAAGKYGNNPLAAWKVIGKDPLNPPRGATFYADQYRHGLLDVYDKDAFRMAMRYLQQGASNRFMKEAYDQARTVVTEVAKTNERLALPMGYFLQALKGYEFSEHREALNESFQRMLEFLPGQADASKVRDVAESITNFYIGSAYLSTMGMRPGVAARNAFQTVLMTWPVFGGRKGDYIEALAKALTKAGRDEAITARAIAVKQGSVFMREELASGMPKEFERLTELGMKLYDSADEFTRSVAYHSGRIKAQRALIAFANDAQAGRKSAETLQRNLVSDAGLFIHDPQVVEEFMRRAATDPEAAASFAGKQAADVTNFLYGRGMQPRWMRSLPGRLFGQFGTWSLWYIDYLRRLGGAALRGPSRGAALGALAKHALVNAAIIAAGKSVFDVDLSRWAAHGAIFYSGGPSLALVAGASTLMRGMGSQATLAEDPLSQSRVTQGESVIEQTLPTFVPFYFAGRDAIRLSESQTPTELLANLLSTHPTEYYTASRKLELLLGEPREFQATDAAAAETLNAKAGGQQLPTLGEYRQLLLNGQVAGTSTAQGAPSPQGAAPIAQQQLRSAAPARPGAGLTPPPGAPATPAGIKYQGPNEVRRPAEAKPIKEY